MLQAFKMKSMFEQNSCCNILSIITSLSDYTLRKIQHIYKSKFNKMTTRKLELEHTQYKNARTNKNIQTVPLLHGQ